jgi:hypothetical protein
MCAEFAARYNARIVQAVEFFCPYGACTTAFGTPTLQDLHNHMFSKQPWQYTSDGIGCDQETVAPLQQYGYMANWWTNGPAYDTFQTGTTSAFPTSGAVALGRFKMMDGDSSCTQSHVIHLDEAHPYFVMPPPLSDGTALVAAAAPDATELATYDGSSGPPQLHYCAATGPNAPALTTPVYPDNGFVYFIVEVTDPANVLVNGQYAEILVLSDWDINASPAGTCPSGASPYCWRATLYDSSNQCGNAVDNDGIYQTMMACQ